RLPGASTVRSLPSLRAQRKPTKQVPGARTVPLFAGQGVSRAAESQREPCRRARFDVSVGHRDSPPRRAPDANCTPASAQALVDSSLAPRHRAFSAFLGEPGGAPVTFGLAFKQARVGVLAGNCPRRSRISANGMPGKKC